MKKRILDAHSHIGLDSFYPFEGTLNEYVTNSVKIGITDSVIMPVTSPAIYFNNHKFSDLLWQYNSSSKTFTYLSFGISDQITNSKVYIHPYASYNNMISVLLNDFVNNNINFHFVPLVHPLLDSIEYIEYLLSTNPVAIKIHGIAAGIYPNQVPKEFWNLIKRYDIPIIVHTDFDANTNNSAISILRNENSSLNWVKILDKKNIKGYITHGARLNIKSIDIINHSDLFVVGIGPDSLISLEPERLENSDIYLKQLFKLISLDKLCFDLDYPWNVKKPISSLKNSKTDLDFDSIERIKNLGLSRSELDKVLFFNASKFYNIK